MTKKLNKYTLLYKEAAEKLKYQTTILHRDGLLKITSGKKSWLIYRAITPLNSAVVTTLCQNKSYTNALLTKAGLPCPPQRLISTSNQAVTAARKLGLPVVLKPIKGIGGKDVFANVSSLTKIRQISHNLLSRYQTHIIEPHVSGQDYRLLILNSRIIGLLTRTPPTITGNGRSTVKELIEQLQSKKRLVQDEVFKEALKDKNATLDTILPKNETIFLRRNANYSTGGLAITLPINSLHPDLINLAITATEILKATLAGVDLLIKNPKKPRQQNAVILEVNPSPGTYMHHYPDQGQPQLVSEKIVKYLGKNV